MNPMSWKQVRPLPGSLEEAARKIERILDLEDARRSGAGEQSAPAEAAGAVGRGLMALLMLDQSAGPAYRPGPDDQGPLVMAKGLKKYCTEKYERCIDEDWGGDWTCGQCHFYCTGNNGHWPGNHCSPHLPKRRRSSPFKLPPPIIFAPLPRPGGSFGGKRLLPYDPGLYPLLP